MKVAVRYYSKTNNTRKLAEAIGECLNIEVKTVEEKLEEDVDILFLGSSVYAGGIDSKVKNFINNLDSSKVKKVVNFSSAAVLTSTYKQVKEMVEAKGIEMSKEEFHCKGSFGLVHKGRPNNDDIKAFKEFALKIAK